MVQYVTFSLRVFSDWFLRNLKTQHRNNSSPIHVMFCLVDHFEPGTGNVGITAERGRMQRLLSKYPNIADRHKDSYGNRPKRTWFFPPHYHRYGNLKDLSLLCESGYGEIELHLHHGKSRPDTSENLENTILQCLEEYGYFGVFGSEDGRRRYGFIHGDWALNNSLNGKYCGVNDEIRILSRTGCYADFTFPALNRANPNRMNCIFYADDTEVKPKSFDKNFLVSRLGKREGELMVIQGPLFPTLMWSRIKGFGIVPIPICGDAINGRPPVTVRRIDSWVKTGICVQGKRDWIVVKTHTHGATDADEVLGENMDNIFDYIEHRYNDGKNYLVHYVTARELYNIIKAIEAGESGTNPEQYRNYRIAAPQYDSSTNIYSGSARLRALLAKGC